MVVLLESARLRDSLWTQHEIDFIKRNRLGLASLQMPDLAPADALPSVTIGPRIKLQKQDFSAEPAQVEDPAEPGPRFSQWPALKESVLDDVITQIKTAHSEALFRRRHTLRADLVVALKEAGLKAEYRALGPLEVSNDTDAHLVWLTTRPPEVDDFRSVYTAHFARTTRSGGSRGLIVGPRAAQEPDRLDRLAWLHRVSECLSFDEGNLAEFAKRIKEGQWD
jgi:hypothetical protein